MLDIEVIKWGCEFADGFEYDILIDDGEYPYVRCHNGAAHYLGDFPFHDIDFDMWEKVYYPLFLQRVIEGINKTVEWVIDVSDCFMSVYDGDYNFLIQINIPDYRNIDEAKEQAIKYIYDNKEK